MQGAETVEAAGAVVWRRRGATRQVLLVHRPKYDDWTLPKGKADAGERLPVTAVREILEETSVAVRLGMPLTRIMYPVTKPRPMTKHVSYWIARPLDDGTVHRTPDAEVDDVRWVDLGELPETLTYARDRGIVERFCRLVEHSAHKTRPLVVLRHAAAYPRKEWKGNDRRRPLSEEGQRQARELVPLLAAFGVRQVVTSDSVRCVQTVEPFTSGRDLEVDLEKGLTEEDATLGAVAATARSLLAAKTPVVVCTHRPVVPQLFAALGLPSTALEPAQLLVLHRRDGEVLGTELHRP
ncbi:MAG: NUDIX hydrolase [Nocardioidaceae bacterium]